MRTSLCIAVMFCSTPIWVYALPKDGAPPLLIARATPVEQYCANPRAGCIPLWHQMSSAERAKIWPLLDRTAKETYWRHLSPKERKDLRRHLSVAERDRLRHRFSVRDPEQCRDENVRLPLRKEQRIMIRQQIIEVRQEMKKRKARRMQHRHMRMQELPSCEMRTTP